MTPEYFIRTNALEAADSLVANAQETNYSVDNITDRLSYRWWRVSGDTAYVDVAWTTSQTLRELLVRFHTVRTPRDSFHNFGSNDTIKIDLSNVAAGGTDVHTTGAQPLSVDDYGYHLEAMDADYSAFYARITVTAPDVIAAGGLLEIEEMHFGVPWFPSRNSDTGGSEDQEDLTDYDIGEYSGANIGEPRARYDEFERSWGAWTPTDAADWRRFKRTHGTSRTFVYVAYANEPLLKQPMIARFTKAPNFTEIGPKQFEISATIVENR